MSGDPPVRLADFAAGPLLVGWVVADDVSLSPGGDALGRVVADAVDTVGDVDDHPVKKAVRDLLRGHRYKPSGRGKPASEFLRAAARRGSRRALRAAPERACRWHDSIGHHRGRPALIPIHLPPTAVELRRGPVYTRAAN